jgi:hypothetical protein
MRTSCLRFMVLGALVAGALASGTVATADPGTESSALAPSAVGIVTATVLETHSSVGGGDDATGETAITLAVSLLYFPPGSAIDVYVAGTSAAEDAQSFALLGTVTADGKGGATLIGTSSVTGWEMLVVRAVPAGGSAAAPLALWTGTAMG